MLYHQLFENRDLEWCSRSAEMSLFFAFRKNAVILVISSAKTIYVTASAENDGSRLLILRLRLALALKAVVRSRLNGLHNDVNINDKLNFTSVPTSSVSLSDVLSDVIDVTSN